MMSGGQRGFSINIFKYSEARLFVNDIFQRRCHRNRRYSLRAYARDLNLSCGLLSEFLRGKRHLSDNSLFELGSSLKLSDAEIRYLKAIAKNGKNGHPPSQHLAERAVLRREAAYAPMNSDEWPGAELNLREFSLVIVASLWDGFSLPDVRLLFPDSSIEDIHRACLKLQELGWLAETSDIWRAPYGFLRSRGTDPSSGIRAFHRQLLEAGLSHLDHSPVDERFYYASLFSLSSREYQGLCKAIEGFVLDRSDSIDTRDEHDRIYALGFQLLPITGGFPSRRKKLAEAH